MNKIYRCFNRTCRVPVSKPGKCEVCARMWKHTCEVAQAAYDKQKVSSQKTTAGVR